MRGVVARGLAAEPHRYGRALCALDLAGGGSFFPLNNSVLPPPAKHLMRLARIKRACYLRTRAAHVRRYARRRAMRAWNRSGSRLKPHRVGTLLWVRHLPLFSL